MHADNYVLINLLSYTLSMFCISGTQTEMEVTMKTTMLVTLLIIFAVVASIQAARK